MSRFYPVAAFAAAFFVSTSAFAGAIVDVPNQQRFFEFLSGGRGPDFEINFGRNVTSTFYISPNGLIHFATEEWAADDFYSSNPSLELLAPYVQERQSVIIAPFFADTNRINVLVTTGSTTFNGHDAFAVNWFDAPPGTAEYDDMGNTENTLRNTFQLLLVDQGNGNIDIVFNYGSIEWDNASSGSPFGANSFIGYSTGDGVLHGWATDSWEGGTSIDSQQLASNSLNANAQPSPNFFRSLTGQSTEVPGRYVFEVRDGIVTNGLPMVPVPEPETWAMLLAGLGVVGFMAKRRAKDTV